MAWSQYVGPPSLISPYIMATTNRRPPRSAAATNVFFAATIAQPAATFPTKAGDRPIVNDDELLHRYPGTLGGKTGFTDAAKKTFVAAADRGGRRLVIAMMYGLIKEGGPTYWDQAIGLFDWGFAQDRQMSVSSL